MSSTEKKNSLAKEKFIAVERCLLDEYVLVHVNTTSDDLILPDHLKKNTTITLKLSKLFRGKLLVEADRVEAELLFNESYFNCVLPFSAIWGLTSEKGSNIVWPDSAPPEVLSMLAQHHSADPKPDKPKVKAPIKPSSHLTRIK